MRKQKLIILPILVIIIYLIIICTNIFKGKAANVEEPIQMKDSTAVLDSICEDKLVLLENKFDTILFNPETNCAEWVKWKITPDRVGKKKVKRSDYPFLPDDTEFLKDKVTTKDYSYSGYDRGHLCPAADNEHSAQAMKDCMEMTNIIPQTPELNRGPWKTLEDNCRNIAKRDGTVVYIVAGPVFSDTAEVKWIGDDRKIQVPDKCFKVIYIPKTQKAIGWIMENTKTPISDYQKYRVSVDSVENLTGYDFFDWLPDSLECLIEK